MVREAFHFILCYPSKTAVQAAESWDILKLFLARERFLHKRHFLATQILFRTAVHKILLWTQCIIDPAYRYFELNKIPQYVLNTGEVIVIALRPYFMPVAAAAGAA